MSDIHHISEVDIRNALYSPIGPLVGVKTNWDYRQLMGLKGPAFVNVLPDQKSTGLRPALTVSLRGFI